LSDPLDLLGEWNGADLAIVVDAIHSGAPVGTLQTIEIDVENLSCTALDAESGAGESSTHGLGLVAVFDSHARSIRHLDGSSLSASRVNDSTSAKV